MFRIVATTAALVASSACALAEEGRADRLLDFLEAASHTETPYAEVEVSPTAYPQGGYFSVPPICLHLMGDPGRIETGDQMRWLDQCRILYGQVQGRLMRNEYRSAGGR